MCQTSFNRQQRLMHSDVPEYCVQLNRPVQPRLQYGTAYSLLCHSAPTISPLLACMEKRTTTGTFNHFCRKLLRDEYVRIGISTFSNILKTKVEFNTRYSSHSQSPFCPFSPFPANVRVYSVRFVYLATTIFVADATTKQAIEACKMIDIF